MTKVKTGKLDRSQRVWAALHLLLTCPAISEARDKTTSGRLCAGA